MQFSEREMCKQHMDIYLRFYFHNNIFNGKGKENPKKCTQYCCEATGIDRLALSHKLDLESHLEDTLNIFDVLEKEGGSYLLQWLK